MNNCTHGTIRGQRCISLETTCCFCCDSWQFELTVLFFKTSWITTKYAEDRHMPYPCSKILYQIWRQIIFKREEESLVGPLPFWIHVVCFQNWYKLFTTTWTRQYSMSLMFMKIFNIIKLTVGWSSRTWVKEIPVLCVYCICASVLSTTMSLFLYTWKKEKKGSIVRMLEDVLQQTFAALHQQAGTVRHSRPCVRPLVDAQ